MRILKMFWLCGDPGAGRGPGTTDHWCPSISWGVMGHYCDLLELQNSSKTHLTLCHVETTPSKQMCLIWSVFMNVATSFVLQNKENVQHIRAFARFKNILSLFPMLLHPNYRANQYKYQIIEDKYFWQNCPWPRMLKIQKLTENNSIEYFQTKV